MGWRVFLAAMGLFCFASGGCVRERTIFNPMEHPDLKSIGVTTYANVVVEQRYTKSAGGHHDHERLIYQPIHSGGGNWGVAFGGSGPGAAIGAGAAAASLITIDAGATSVEADRSKRLNSNGLQSRVSKTVAADVIAGLNKLGYRATRLPDLQLVKPDAKAAHRFGQSIDPLTPECARAFAKDAQAVLIVNLTSIGIEQRDGDWGDKPRFFPFVVIAAKAYDTATGSPLAEYNLVYVATHALPARENVDQAIADTASLQAAYEGVTKLAVSEVVEDFRRSGGPITLAVPATTPAKK